MTPNGYIIYLAPQNEEPVVLECCEGEQGAFAV